MPFAPGTLTDARQVSLSSNGGPVPLQSTPLVRWPDQSIRWLLIDFLADVRRHGYRRYVLRTRSDRARPVLPQPVRVRRRADRIGLANDRFQIEVGSGDSLARLVHARGAFDIDLFGAVRRYGSLTATKPDVDIETRGPVRATVCLTGRLGTRQKSAPHLEYRVRLHMYAGSDLVCVEHLIVNDDRARLQTLVKNLGVRLRPMGAEAPTGRIGGVSGAWSIGAGTRAFQKGHGLVQISGDLGSRVRRGTLPGWASIRSEGVRLDVSVRDLALQWPKDFVWDGDAMNIGLFPAWESVKARDMEQWTKHLYLFERDAYVLKVGVAKRHEFWLRLDERKSMGGAAGFHRSVQSPLFAAAPGKYVSRSGALGTFKSDDDVLDRDWNRLFDQMAGRFRKRQHENQETGVLNAGDWYGERQTNWGNNEYDTAFAFYMQFLRTGRRDFLETARRAAWHVADVDTLHHVNRVLQGSATRQSFMTHGFMRGQVYPHTTGHVSSYRPPPALSARGRHEPAVHPYNAGHHWTQGLAACHVLTGDRWCLETLRAIGDWQVAVSETPGYTYYLDIDTHSARVAGWSLLSLMAAYRVTRASKYLRASRRIVDLVLESADPHSGAWHYPLYGAHCGCRIKHVGQPAFLTGILLGALLDYDEDQRDRRISDAIVRAVRYMIRSKWDDPARSFRMTECPATESLPELNGLCLRSLFYASRITGDARLDCVARAARQSFIEHLEKSFSGMGKDLTLAARDMPAVLGLMESD
ncbi:MAG: hypothetical protein CMJ18_22620 [Phycisphaeraceae bacterium]|nr:hypothetical protein [Phycisphaeraceae bacterium]